MDTITHGIAGALIAKAVCKGGDVFSPAPVSKARVITWSVMLGSIFPDSDVLREFFSRDPMLIVTWHRSITHSLICLPIWAAILAAVTFQICRWRKWESPSYVSLCALWGVGIFSHIFLDLVTTFGTMVWSPLNWSRPAWDVLFIIDFSFTAILLIPQLLAWTYEDPDHLRRRAVTMWLIFTPVPLLISKLAAIVGAPTSNNAIVVVTVLFAALFLLPAVRGWGARMPYVRWNLAGLALAVLYVLSAALAHRVALRRTEEFISTEHIEAQSFAALPLPPSLWHWAGLVQAPGGVYLVRMDLSEGLFSPPVLASTVEHIYYPDAPTNAYIEKARNLPNVRKFLWFARFPVTRFHKEGPDAVVEFLDVRFPQIRRDRQPSFDYVVRISVKGDILSQGWAGK
jgi:membrane-bound metal-dependent hydrolase YbcI (DUF457 family)